MADHDACQNCGAALKTEDAACPGCGIPREEALGEKGDEGVTEASKESFPASDPPAY